jgi:hypothetical protein
LILPPIPDDPESSFAFIEVIKAEVFKVFVVEVPAALL